MLFGKLLRDYLPNPVTRYKPREEWRLLASERERALAKRATASTENLLPKTKDLGKLSFGQEVRIQNQAGEKPKRWDNTGVVVKCKGFDQYLVKNDGSGRLTLRNRQFLKPIVPYGKVIAIKTQLEIIDASPGPSSGLDIDTFVGNEERVSGGQRVRTAPDRLHVTGKGQSYKSHQTQSVCGTSFAQVLRGGGGHQGDWARPRLGCGGAKPERKTQTNYRINLRSVLGS